MANWSIPIRFDDTIRIDIDGCIQSAADTKHYQLSIQIHCDG